MPRLNCYIRIIYFTKIGYLFYKIEKGTSLEIILERVPLIPGLENQLT